jgi:hypothetical protein
MGDHPPHIDANSLAPRDRVRRQRSLAMSPAERLAAMRQLIEQSWAILQKNPEGVARFRRRNFQARAVRTPFVTVEK